MRDGGRVESYRDLRAWQQAMTLAVQCYKLTRAFPKEEQYGLTAQIRRASASVPSNIAEGSGRGSRKEYAQFLHVARGSLRELETQLLLSVEIGFADAEVVQAALLQSEAVGKMLLGLIRSLDAQRADNRSAA
jgi:four helix bundle protein